MFLFVHRLLIDGVGHCYRLDYGFYNVSLRVVLVWLDTRQTEGCQPFHRVSRARYNFSAFRKPLLYLICVLKQVTDAFDCDSGQVLSGSVELTICIVNSSFFKLLLDLLSCTDKCHTVDRGHYRLFNYFSCHIAFQPFCYFYEIRIIFFFNVSQNELKDC